MRIFFRRESSSQPYPFSASADPTTLKSRKVGPASADPTTLKSRKVGPASADPTTLKDWKVGQGEGAQNCISRQAHRVFSRTQHSTFLKNSFLIRSV